jgi:hypothetical protein
MNNYVELRSKRTDLLLSLKITLRMFDAICIYSTVEKYKGKYFRMMWAAEMSLTTVAMIKKYRELLRKEGILQITWFHNRRYYFFSTEGKRLQKRIQSALSYKKSLLKHNKLRGELPITTLKYLKEKGYL